MQRQETLSVWSPELDDEVFTVESDGHQWEAITTITDDGEEKHIGSRPTGSRVTFEFHFPTADTDAEPVLESLLSADGFKHSSTKMNGQYTVFDMEYNSAFDTGCETDRKIVVHTKRNATAETMRKIYTTLTGIVDTRVRVIRYYYEY